MPFPKLRLKKSKQQYNVASKAMYVITVELLDNNQLECTLTAESTGKKAFQVLLKAVLKKSPLHIYFRSRLHGQCVPQSKLATT